MSTQVTASVVSASAAFVVAVIGIVVTHNASKRDRRRQLYGEAVKSAVSWKEMLYRVRRRAEGDEASLVTRFHDLQDTITFHRAWIGSESRSIGRSYDRLVRDVKAKTELLITEAWDAPVRPAPGNAQPGDQHPDVQDDAERFLKDLRAHLSLQPWRRIALWLRSRNYT